MVELTIKEDFLSKSNVMEELNMKNVVIVPKVAIPRAFGLDGRFLFKKSWSRQFKEKLNKRFLESGMNYQASVDITYEDLETLLSQGANVLLISPYIKNKVNTDNLNSGDYYVLSRDEFNNTQVEDVLKFLIDIDFN